MPSPTVEQIVDFCRLRLKPELAIINWERGWRSYCVSPTYTSVITEDGQTVDLVNSPLINAIYVRVSTAAQAGLTERDDGYSVEHQLRSNIHAALAAGLPFRVYSDVGLSGFLPTNDEAIIHEMRCLRAEIYANIYEEVILKDAHTWNTIEQIADMRRFLEHRRKAILAGEKDPMVEETPTDRNSSHVERLLILRYQHSSSDRGFRPGLHALIEDLPSLQRIFVTDPDRLSRNQVLFYALGKEFRKNEVEVYASTGRAEWMTGTDLGSQLQHVFMTWEAQRRLVQVKQGVMRGLVTMLRKGKPHSTLPFWLERDKNGFARFVPIMLPVIKTLISLAQQDEYLGISRLAQRLVDLDVPSPRGKFWHGDTVGYVLRNPLLYGVQIMFGREWPIHDSEGNSLALIDRETFLVMHYRRQGRYQNARGRPSPRTALMSGLMHCQCGYTMMYRQPSPSGPDRYYCHAPATEKRRTTAAGLRHTTLRPDELNQFFRDLVNERADVLLQAKRSREVEDLDAQEQTIRATFEAKERQERAKYGAILQAGGASEDSPAFQAALEATLQAVMSEEYRTTKQALAHIDRQRTLRALAAKGQTAAEQLERFQDLTPKEQNRILKTLIKRIDVKGEPPNEYLVISTWDSDEPLPYVYLHTEVHKNGNFYRHVPTLDEWIASWLTIPPEETNAA